MANVGPIKQASDARSWSGVNDDTYPFEVRAETFAFGAEERTGQDDSLVLEAGDEYVDADSDGATTLTFRCAERRTDGTWTLVWDMASTNPHDDGRVSSGGPGAWAMQIREGDLVPADQWTDAGRKGVVDL